MEWGGRSAQLSVPKWENTKLPGFEPLTANSGNSGLKRNDSPLGSTENKEIPVEFPKGTENMEIPVISISSRPSDHLPADQELESSVMDFQAVH